jgi:hypothetical protein
MNPLVLSYRAADRALRARKGTTAALVAAGRVRFVPWGRSRRVPAADLERVASEGILPDFKKPRGQRRKPTASGIGDRIRAMTIPGVDS